VVRKRDRLSKERRDVTLAHLKDHFGQVLGVLQFAAIERLLGHAVLQSVHDVSDTTGLQASPLWRGWSAGGRQQTLASRSMGR
jgi:hypothetical protein